MIIEYYTQSVYGKDLHYIKDPAIRRFHAALTGKSTINAEDMRNYTNFSHDYITFMQTMKEQPLNPVLHENNIK